MRKGLLRDFILLLVIGGALLIGGYFLARKIWYSDLDLSYKVSYEQENKLGDVFNDMILNQYTVIENNEADTAVHKITDRLIHALDSSRYRYQFVILKSKQINAFTIPGGNIYIFSGLIQLTETPEELAAVLAHEIGHAEKRHVVSKLIKQLSITVLLSSTTGGDPGLIAQVLKEIVGNSFDRDQETDADQFGLSLLEKAKISPKNLARFFERLNAKDMDYDENLEILMTHPHNNKRIEQTRRYKTKNGFQPELFEINWEKAQESVKD